MCPNLSPAVLATKFHPFPLVFFCYPEFEGEKKNHHVKFVWLELPFSGSFQEWLLLFLEVWAQGPLIRKVMSDHFLRRSFPSCPTPRMLHDTLLLFPSRYLSVSDIISCTICLSLLTRKAQWGQGPDCLFNVHPLSQCPVEHWTHEQLGMCVLNVEWMNVSLLFPVPHSPFQRVSNHCLSHIPCPRLPAFR